MTDALPILVLFQNPTDRRLVTEFLEDHQFQCETVDSSEGLSQLLSSDQISDYSLLLMDVHVAVSFGEQILKSASSVKSHLPVILALPKEASRSYWLRSGFHDILNMPVPKAELLARVQANLRKSGRTQEHLERVNETLRRQNEELRKANIEAQAGLKAKFQFLANMSHELRTPLHGIALSAHNLKEINLEPSDEAAEQIEMIEVSVDSLLGLVDSILDVTRFEHAEFQINRRDFELRKYMGALIAPIRAKAKEKGLAFDFTVDSHVPETFYSDPVRLGQVVSNLVSNAVKFTKEGSVRCFFRWQDDVLSFEVTDTGSGIAQEKLSSVFERFYQVDDSDTRALQGAGLGLAIVKNLVERLGGKISVESELNVGTKFEVCFPLKADDLETTTEDQDPSEHQPEKALKILLVEDNRISLKALTTMLENQNHHVTGFEDPLEVAELPELDYDVAIFDIQMPGLRGTELTKLIRQREAERKAERALPILALTAAVSEKDKAVCLDAGMDQYMSKPPKPDVLFETLYRLAEGGKKIG